MKIIILVRILWTSGAQKIAIEQTKALEKLGYEVKLIFLRETESGKNLNSSLSEVNYEIFSNRLAPRWIYSSITGMFVPERKGEGALDYDLLKNFSESVKIGDADYIICHDQWAGVAGLKIYKNTGIPYSVFCHERITGSYSIPIVGNYVRRTEETVLKSAKKVFGVTEKVADSIKSTYNINAKQNLPGMDIKETKKFKDKKNVLLASATWDKNRKPMNYLNIIDKLQDFKLFFVGRWRVHSEYEEFLNYISNHDISERVFMKPEISEVELQSLYTDAKFSLRFGQEEWGLGTSNVEAISHLTPIIINSELGISDLILRMGGGLVTDKININMITDFIKNNNVEEKYTELQRQLLKITSEITWEKHVKNLII